MLNIISHAEFVGVPVGMLYRPVTAPFLNDDTELLPGQRSVPQEYSPCNQATLRDALKSLHEPKAILEIGMERKPHSPSCSTTILVNEKPDDCVYLGVDLRDCRYIENPDKNVHMIVCDSNDVRKIMAKARELGVSKFDLIHIDGWHSVNQCIADWQFVEYLAPEGVVVAHDSNEHFGPIAMFDAVDPAFFDKRRICGAPNDWGISVFKNIRPLERREKLVRERKAGILIQGPLMFADRMSKAYEGLPVIWSTWREEPDEAKKLLLARGVEIVETPIPPENLRGTGNANLQIISTAQGLIHAERLGYTHVLRPRHDVILERAGEILDRIEEQIGYLCVYRGYLMDYVVSGPVDKLRLLYATRFPMKPENGIFTENFMSRRRQQLFPYEEVQYLFPILKELGITAHWIREASTTVNPLNRYYTDLPYRNQIDYRDVRKFK